MLWVLFFNLTHVYRILWQGKSDSTGVTLWSCINSKQYTSDYPHRSITWRHYSPFPFPLNTCLYYISETEKKKKLKLRLKARFDLKCHTDNFNLSFMTIYLITFEFVTSGDLNEIMFKLKRAKFA